MNKLQRQLQTIENIISILNRQLEAIYLEMEECDDLDEMFDLDCDSTDITERLAMLEVERHEAVVLLNHQLASRGRCFDNDYKGFIK